ncbi:unnamed protein product [Linum trigynum]|uniref:Uncharacterized protein n=1 Tax=Linum trigynum TaxID=586398 RepID=A0AAV2EWH3_9ROSI
MDQCHPCLFLKHVEKKVMKDSNVVAIKAKDMLMSTIWIKAINRDLNKVVTLLIKDSTNLAYHTVNALLHEGISPRIIPIAPLPMHPMFMKHNGKRNQVHLNLKIHLNTRSMEKVVSNLQPTRFEKLEATIIGLQTSYKILKDNLHS